MVGERRAARERSLVVRERRRERPSVRMRAWRSLREWREEMEFRREV